MTSTTIPFPQKEAIVVLENLMSESPQYKRLKMLNDANQQINLDRNQKMKIFLNIPVNYNSLIPPDFAVR